MERRQPTTIIHAWPALPSVGTNVVVIVADDLGLPSMQVYDDQNAWPDPYGGPTDSGYPVTPWFDDLATHGIRFNTCRVSARCTPTRGQLQTGRYPFQHGSHAGTGLGDVQNSVFPASIRTSLEQSMYPMGYVLRQANTTYQTAGFGKWHLNDSHRLEGAGPFTDPGTNEIPLDPDSAGAYEYWGGPCEDGGYEYWNASTLYTAGLESDGVTPWGSGTGHAGRGYFEFHSWVFTRPSLAVTTPTHVSTTSYVESDGKFIETDAMEKIDAWLTGLDSDLPFFMQWHTHIPHSVLGALPPASGPSGATIHTTFSEVELIPGAVTGDGKVLTTASNGGYNSSGVFQGGSVPWAEANRYTSEGAVNVAWRRHLAYTEALDYYCNYLEGLILARRGQAALDSTLFVFIGDNGDSGADMVPRTDPYLSPDFEVLPPTTDDTPGGPPYHNSNHMKGSSYELGTRVPCIFGGASGNVVIPANLKGTTNATYIDIPDLYPTLLDIVAPSWSTYLQGENVRAEVDGLSLISILNDKGTDTGRSFSISEIFGPPGAVCDPVSNEQKRLIAVVNGANWKIIQMVNDGSAAVGGGGVTAAHIELYNLTADPEEATDLFGAATDDPPGSFVLQARNNLQRLSDHLYEVRYPSLSPPNYPIPV